MLCLKFTHIKFIYQQYTDVEHFNMSVRSEFDFYLALDKTSSQD